MFPILQASVFILVTVDNVTQVKVKAPFCPPHDDVQ